MTVAAGAFAESTVAADGFEIRYLEAGRGAPLVWLHGGGGLHLSRAHELLAERYRLIALEIPGFGTSGANERTTSYPELGATLRHALQSIGIERCNLWGTSFGGTVAFWLAVGAPAAIETLVLEGPGAILPDAGLPAAATPDEARRRLFAHPERQPVAAPPDPALVAQQRALIGRLPRPSRADTERALSALDTPTLVVFGRDDQIIPPGLGRIYREKMPSCHFVLLYDAGHQAATERPEAFSSLVGDFLERREAFIVNDRSSLVHP